MTKGTFIDYMAKQLLPAFSYTVLSFMYTEKRSKTNSTFNEDKVEKIFSQLPKFKPYLENYESVKDLVEAGKLEEAKQVINNINN